MALCWTARTFPLPGTAEFNPQDPALAADPAGFWQRITQGPRLLAAGRRAVAVWRHADVRAVLRRHGAKCPERALAAMPPGRFRTHNEATMAFLDPPRHGPVRHAVARSFAPAVLSALAPRIEALSRSLIEALPPSPELVADYAGRLPLAVIAEILDVGAHDEIRLREAAGAVVAGLEPGADSNTYARADAAIEDLMALIGPRLRAPRPGSLFDTLHSSGLPFDVLMHNAIMLLNAGHETTTRLIAGLGRVLIMNPGLPTGPGLIEEVLRLDPPLPFVPRFLHEEWEGLPAGTPVLLLIAAANLDPAVFDAPQQLDPGRANAADHLSFAAGRHFCLGAALARLEAGIAARHLAELAPGLALGAGAARTSGRMFQGWRKLPLVEAR